MILPEQDAKLFFRLYLPLLGFANRYDGARIKRAVMEARKILYANPDILTDFISKNPEKLSKNELEYIRGWQKYVKDDFILAKNLKQHAILLGVSDKTHRLYGVLGIVDPIINLAQYGVGTYFTDVILLPWQGKIIWDGLSFQKSIGLGLNLMNEIRNKYKEAKQNNKIILSI